MGGKEERAAHKGSGKCRALRKGGECLAEVVRDNFAACGKFWSFALSETGNHS